VREHVDVADLQRLLPSTDSKDKALFAHVLLCRECRNRALDILKVPRPPSAMEEIEEQLDRIGAVFSFLLDAEEERGSRGALPCGRKERKTRPVSVKSATELPR
jgi:hypothetical protein